MNKQTYCKKLNYSYLKQTYSLPDLNRYSNQNQILSLTCLPIPPNEHLTIICKLRAKNYTILCLV